MGRTESNGMPGAGRSRPLCRSAVLIAALLGAAACASPSGPFEGAKNQTMWDKIARDRGYENQKALEQHMDEVGFLNAVDSIPTVAGTTDLPVETCGQVGDRALGALRDIAGDQRNDSGDNVLLVSSGITILCLLDRLDADLEGVHGIDNAAVT